ncbi:DUF2187 family protein [Virgibacillus xinjiangensis]|uniref:DUF2187 family protein n=1 Tax=Virgibacillus xinjiangensis TaxID=393090 RepID=A0ABV7CWZ3_9BACI
MFHPDNKKAKPGDIVEFMRDGMLFQGKVLPSKCKNSIIVDFSSIMHNWEKVSSYPNTVVGHGKYRVVTTSRHKAG